jgi:flagellar protein FliS
MVQTAHNAYSQNYGNTILSQEELLLKLYEGALKFLRLARRGIEEKNPKVKGENISKVIAIISELTCALDMESGGDMANNLAALYEHIIFSLINANLKNDMKGLNGIERILAEIKDGFEIAMKSSKEMKKIIPQDVSEQGFHDHKEGIRLAI